MDAKESVSSVSFSFSFSVFFFLTLGAQGRTVFRQALDKGELIHLSLFGKQSSTVTVLFCEHSFREYAFFYTFTHFDAELHVCIFNLSSGWFGDSDLVGDFLLYSFCFGDFFKFPCFFIFNFRSGFLFYFFFFSNCKFINCFFLLIFLICLIDVY